MFAKMSSPGGNGQRVHRISVSLLFSILDSTIISTENIQFKKFLCLSVIFYIRLHSYLNRKYLIKKKTFQPEKKKWRLHTLQMHSFYLRRTISRQCPLGKASLIIRYIEINHYSRQSTKIHASVTSIQ